MKKHLALIAAAGILGLGGCYGSYTNPTTFTLAVADAPVDGAEHVTLAFTGVQIQPSAGNTLEYDFGAPQVDRKSTRLNSSHPSISYAVFCLKKKTSYYT